MNETCKWCPKTPVIEVKDVKGVSVFGCHLHADRAERKAHEVEVKRLGAPKFQENQHPRDRAGRFIEVGGHVSIFGGGSGTVIRVVGGGRVEVDRDVDHKRVTLDAGYLTVTDPVKPTAPAQGGAPDAPGGPGAATAPDTSPVGAISYFEADDGAQAWLKITSDGALAGFIRDDPADPSTTTRLSPSDWQAELEKRGVDKQHSKTPPTADAAPTAAAPAAPDEAIRKVAAAMHEDWRKERNYEPRMKDDGNGGEVDIAATTFDRLPDAFKTENVESAKSAVAAAQKHQKAGLTDEALVEAVAADVHVAWMERNGSWAPPEQMKDYDALSDVEKEKDRVVARHAIAAVAEIAAPPAAPAGRQTMQVNADGSASRVVEPPSAAPVQGRQTMHVYPDGSAKPVIEVPDTGQPLPPGGLRVRNERGERVIHVPVTEAEADVTPFRPETLTAAGPVSPGVDPEKAASGNDVVALFKDGLEDFEGFGAWHMSTEGDTPNFRQRDAAAKQAKREVVADLSNRMQGVEDRHLLNPADMDTLRRIGPGGDSTLIRVPERYSPGAVNGHGGEIIPGIYSERVVNNDALARVMDSDPDEDGGLARQGILVIDAETFRNERRDEQINRFVQTWALSSNGVNPRSLVLQEIAAETFGLEGTADWDADLHTDTLDEMDRIRADEGPAMRAFLLAQYEATQDRFKAAGITHLPVYRGHKVYGGTPPWAAEAAAGSRSQSDQIALRPLSSFSTDRSVAASFARGISTDESYILTGTLPVEHVLATPRSGVGCLEEAEIVVLGGHEGSWQIERASEVDGPVVDDLYDPAIDGGGDLYYDDEDVPMTDEEITATPAGALATRADIVAAVRLADTPERRQAIATRAERIGMSDLIPPEWDLTDQGAA